MVRADVVVRRFTAALLDKKWLAGIKKGWASLLKPRIDSWDDVGPAVRRLIEFVENFHAQITFKRPLPAKAKGPILAKFDELKNNLAGVNVEWAEGLPGADSILEGLKNDFSGNLVRTGRRVTDPTKAMNSIMRELQKVADAYERANEMDPALTQEVFGGEFDSEFDLYGMKVVVDDSTVTPAQMDQYVDLMKEAYHLLKSKKLDKAWYGTTFIQCQECSSEQYAGHFRVGPNDVSIFTRPGPFVVHTVVHELAHRYWFKHMDKSQRDEFVDLVDVTAQHLDIREVEQHVSRKLSAWAKVSASLAKAGIERLGDLKSSMNVLLKNLTSDAEKLLGAAIEEMKVEGGDDLLKQYRAAVAPYAKALNKARENLDDAFPAELQTPEMREPYLTGISRALDGWTRAHSKALDNLIRSFQASRPAPVSQYGKKDISEAFAEAFAYYVLGMNMTRDQADSFKHVMRLASVEPPDLLLRQGVEFSE